MDKLERDRLLIFLSKLALNQRNVKEVIDAGGIKVLVDLLALAHLHTSRYTSVVDYTVYSGSIITSQSINWV